MANSSVAEVLQKSEARLENLHPIIRHMAVRLVADSFTAGVPIIITQGFRSTEYQNGLYAQGRTKPGPIVTNAKGGRSYHNYGLAVDFALLLPDGKTASWDTRRDGDHDSHKDWYEVAAIGKRIGFEWGGDWDKFVDMPHFQFTMGLSLNELQKGAKPLLKAADANKIIEAYLSPAWNAAHATGDKDGMKRAATLADELRVASGQPKQNS